MNKTATNAAQLAKCILLHAYSLQQLLFQLREHMQNFISLI